MSHRVAFIGFGKVAAALSPVLAASGAEIAAYDVLLNQPGGLETLVSRFQGARVEFCPLPEAVHDAHFVLSTVTAGVAPAAAHEVASHLHRGQYYVDLNSVEPAVKLQIEQVITPTGAAFVEAAVLGAVDLVGAKTEILLGGPHAQIAADELRELGLNARFYSDQLGQASLFKMLRSVFTKGLEALLIEFLVAGQRAGIRNELWRDMTELLKRESFERMATSWIGSHLTAHARRHEEMQQVTGVLRGLRIDPIMTAATTAFFERSGRLGLAKDGTASKLDEIVLHYDRCLGKRS